MLCTLTLTVWLSTDTSVATRPVPVVQAEELSSSLYWIRNQPLFQPAVIATTAKGPVTPVEAVSQVSVYPNPFADDINVSLSLENDLDRVTIRLTDAAGHVVYNKDFSGLRKGEWRQQLQIPGEQLTAGVYILEIRGSDKTLPPRTFKLIKNR